MDKLLPECHHVVLEGDPQHPDQQLFIHPMVGQDGCDGVPQHVCLHLVVPKDLPQPRLDPEQQGLEEYWVVLEQDHPFLRQEATHIMPGHPFHSPPLGCSRVMEVMEVVGGWVAGSSSHLVDNK
ncbi:hypothetical protein llap_7245 [Limosa lapponica baueri]|uniref:Uncharacterized protein n=1 Tax=Limosa lapponica baueri TaxID=1758121 RepID=A0A2I0U8R2_LIMLA|nr:hypothetical protein llap_7245 [Limosa lapponica baueri]